MFEVIAQELFRRDVVAGFKGVRGTFRKGDVARQVNACRKQRQGANRTVYLTQPPNYWGFNRFVS